ncbi:hypothetical protein [Streptomyces sp. URMC 123]|uniref:hypothetical protein n=1 Tax=Streptomyces sp. URMC 123 TaxID=3423403 RepID=UPI003F19AD26
MNVRSFVRRPFLAVVAMALAGAASVVAAAPTAHALGTDYVCAEFDYNAESRILHGYGCQAFDANHAPAGVLFQYRGERAYAFECASAHPYPQDETVVLGLVCDEL